MKTASRYSAGLSYAQDYVAYNERREAGVSREDSLSEAYVDTMFTTAGIGVSLMTSVAVVALISNPVGWAALAGCIVGLVAGGVFSLAVEGECGKEEKSLKRRTYEFMIRKNCRKQT